MKIDRKDIKRLKEGKIPYSLNGKPFIVIRGSVQMGKTDMYFWNYSVTTSPRGEDLTEIKKEDAIKIIEKFDMTEALNNKNGQIYEAKGKPFLERYKNTYKTQR